jgi:hypothetical protein
MAPKGVNESNHEFLCLNCELTGELSEIAGETMARPGFGEVRLPLTICRFGMGSAKPFAHPRHRIAGRDLRIGPAAKKMPCHRLAPLQCHRD